MTVLTREQAAALVAAWPSSPPSLEPCAEINWPLWEAWCAARGRRSDASPVWSEVDVVRSAVLMLRRFLETVTEAAAP